MSIREIPPTEWPSFLEQFSREHRAWLASVERAGPGGAPRTEVADRPLGSVTADVRASRTVRIDIQFQRDADARAVRVDGPARLRVDETQQGAARALEIEDERGECTWLRLRVPAPPGMLDGVVPGEL